MKKLLIILALAILSCSPESTSDECRCEKTTYEYDQFTVISENGLPTLQFVRIDLSTETVPCQDEQYQVSNADGTLFEIICN